MAASATRACPIEFQVKDYREFDGKVDKVVSMGMFEHVGYKNYRTYFEVARRALKGDGLFMLHTIGQQYTDITIDPWLEKYIFPGGVIPSIAQIGQAIDGLWTVIDVHNIGPHYDKTLIAWNDNFEAKWTRRNTPEDVRFYRMWRYYLLCCAGGFRARLLQVWQFVLHERRAGGVRHGALASLFAPTARPRAPSPQGKGAETAGLQSELFSSWEKVDRREAPRRMRGPW